MQAWRSPQNSGKGRAGWLPATHHHAWEAHIELGSQLEFLQEHS